MSKAKAMGTAVETAAVRWFIDNGFPEAERLPLRGSADCGDLRILRNPKVIVECKRAQRGVQLTPWMRELEVEIGNAEASFGLLVAKQAGAGDKRVGRWVTAMHYELFWSQFLGLPTAMEVQHWSYQKINSDYAPALLAPEKIPFAEVERTGRRYIIGPLCQFAELLRRM